MKRSGVAGGGVRGGRVRRGKLDPPPPKKTKKCHPAQSDHIAERVRLHDERDWHRLVLCEERGEGVDVNFLVLLEAYIAVTPVVATEGDARAISVRPTANLARARLVRRR